VPKCLGSEVSWVRSVLTPLTILVKTVVNTNNNTLAKVLLIPIPILLLKSIANTSTNTFVTIHLLFLHSATLIFPQSSINEVNKVIVVEKMTISV